MPDSTMARRGRAQIALAAVVALIISSFGAVNAPLAGADTAPPNPGTPRTVSADVLPTVQVNGVVWDQVIVGNRVYVAGNFTSARPAGSAPGTNETSRRHLLAFDITTGALIGSWAPTLNAQARTIAASADGARIFVAGDFTTVNGVSRSRLAAIDATTGALITGFNPSPNGRVAELVVSGNTLYLGGVFSVVANRTRQRIAAVDATSGGLLAWAPAVNDEVMAITVPPGSGKVVLGGRFSTINGATNRGMGAVSASTGATLAWPANQIIVNWGPDASIWSLNSDGPNVYGTGYTYMRGNGGEGNFEGTFGADTATGQLKWVNGCRGDTYDAVPVGNVLYHVSHHHDCAMVGGLPQTNPWTFQRAGANTTYAAGTNNGGRFSGRPAAQLLHWLPELQPGTFTGKTQAAWTVEADSRYVVLGGEFPRVNNTAQAGLVRFAVPEMAPNRDGPRSSSTLTPALSGPSSGTVRVRWQTTWDRDNARLTYEVLRGSTAANSVVVATRTADTTWWSRPTITVDDTTAPAGTSQTYRIRVRDPLGNSLTSSPSTITVPGTATSTTTTTTTTTTVPPTAGTFASDSFSRTLTSGWGSAEVGGAWTVSSTSGFSVGDGTGRMTVGAGAARQAVLGAAASTSTGATATVVMNQPPTGGGIFTALIGRHVSNGNDYRLKLRSASTGVVTAQLVRTVSGGETVVQSATVPNVTLAAGVRLRMRLQVVGTNPTQLYARVWRDGTVEPGSWLLQATDSTSALQRSGGLGFWSYVSGSATSVPVTLSFDNLVASTVSSPGVAAAGLVADEPTPVPADEPAPAPEPATNTGEVTK
jgi:hypothetical protein